MYENIYYSPEKFNLRIVEVHERPDLDYEFDMVVLWEDIKTRKRYWGADAGCSCPSPFEDITEVSQLQEYRLTKREYEKAVKQVGG